MKTLKFRCTLQSDVILNVKSATEGEQQTLDFIPGNNFLGIVASQLYNSCSAEKALDLFHNGTVRYGDAHPVKKGETTRSIKIPADLFYPKLEDEEGQLYAHHLYRREDDDNEVKPQLKQCRNGYVVAEGKKLKKRSIVRSFAVKSAYDPTKRRSKDQQMYAYESMAQGSEFLFAIETDNESYAEELRNALVGVRHIGRSRTAQYGSVKIEECQYNEEESAESKGNTATVYADSRLIFIDNYGQPTLQPTAQQLGFGPNARIDWAHSQIRSFQYSPWNGKRQAYDADRFGIEKGSVIVVELNGDSNSQPTSNWVGSYRHEGFGKVIYNLHMLNAEEKENGKSEYRIIKKDNDAPTEDEKTPEIKTDTPLLKFLEAQKKARDNHQKIFERVNEFVSDYKKCFKGETFASQWGNIRSIAMVAENTEQLEEKLFHIGDKEHKEMWGYLVHGTAEQRWKQGNRVDLVRDFIEAIKKENDNLVKPAMINLAAEMAKKEEGGDK